MANEPCGGAILKDSTGKILLTDSGKILLSKRIVCCGCELGWTGGGQCGEIVSHENAHWPHCKTPLYIFVTFANLIRFGDDECSIGGGAPCYDCPFPEPPNGHKFKLKYVRSSPYGCFWAADKIIGSDRWIVEYCAHTAAAPLRTVLQLYVMDRNPNNPEYTDSYGLPGNYFLSHQTPYNYEECSDGPASCTPQVSGGLISNVIDHCMDCTPPPNGGCDCGFPDPACAPGCAHGGTGKVEWLLTIPPE